MPRGGPSNPKSPVIQQPYGPRFLTIGLPCLIRVSCHLNVTSHLFWGYCSPGTAIRLAQPKRMPIRNTDVHNLWGMDPGVCCSYYWQVPFISHCWCVCISAQSTQICTGFCRWWPSSAQALQFQHTNSKQFSHLKTHSSQSSRKGQVRFTVEVDFPFCYSWFYFDCRL